MWVVCCLSMFGMGGSEILVILIVALLFLGPDKLPDAAKKISKGIREIKKQSRSLQEQIENDEHVGGAIRDLKSALRGEELPSSRPKPVKAKKKKKELASGETVVTAEPEPSLIDPAKNGEVPNGEADKAADAEDAKPVKLPATAGEADPEVPANAGDEELAKLIKPAAGAIARETEPKHG